MKTKKIVLSMFLPVLAVAFSGKIIDQYKGFVSGADIAVYTTESNEFLGVVQTDSSGSFVIPDSLSAIRTSQLMLPYPNPSFGDVIIPFYCADPGRVEIDIFDLSGRKVRSFMLNCPAEGISQLKWKGLDESGKQAPAGLYLVQMTTENKVTTAKFSRLGKTGPAVYPADLNSIAGDHLSVGKINLDVSAGGESLVRIDSVNMFSDDTLSIYLTRKVDMPFKAEGEFIKICRNGEYEPVFLKGVNLGVAVPGTQPGQMAATREQYASWIRDMAQNGLNYVRTYTLHYPRFYEELRDYNLEHPQSP